MSKQKRLLKVVCTGLLLVACGNAEENTGPADMASMHACEELRSSTANRVIAAASESAADSAIIEINGDPVEITGTGNGIRYATLRLDTEHADVAIFTDAADTITSLTGAMLPAATTSALCSETVANEFRMHIHEPGDYTVHFAAGAPTTVHMLAIITGSGHDDHSGHDH